MRTNLSNRETCLPSSREEKGRAFLDNLDARQDTRLLWCHHRGSVAIVTAIAIGEEMGGKKYRFPRRN